MTLAVPILEGAALAVLLFPAAAAVYAFLLNPRGTP
jgi:hypothetical protein